MDSHQSRQSEVRKRISRTPQEIQDEFASLQREFLEGRGNIAPMPKLAAFFAAWEEIAARVVEWEAENPSEEDKELKELERRAKSVSFAADCDWAWQNLGNRGVRQKDAPNDSAWWLLKYGREEKKAFTELMLRLEGSKNKTVQEKKKLEDDRRRNMEVFAKFVPEIGKCHNCGCDLL